MNEPYFREVEYFCRINGFEFLTSPLIFNRNDGSQEPPKLRVEATRFTSLVQELEQSNTRQTLNDIPCMALLYSFAIDCEGNVHHVIPLCILSVSGE
jgi:hypothetical protein